MHSLSSSNVDLTTFTFHRTLSCINTSCIYGLSSWNGRHAFANSERITTENFLKLIKQMSISFITFLILLFLGVISSTKSTYLLFWMKQNSIYLYKHHFPNQYEIFIIKLRQAVPAMSILKLFGLQWNFKYWSFKYFSA